MNYQQSRAVINDPFPIEDHRAYRPDERPPGFEQPLPEAVRIASSKTRCRNYSKTDSIARVTKSACFGRLGVRGRLVQSQLFDAPTHSAITTADPDLNQIGPRKSL